MSDWIRGSFRPGAARHYDELNQPPEVEAEKGRSGGDEGRGDAGMGGAPRPVPGDDLYAAIIQGEADNAEKQRRANIVARRDDGFSLLAYAAGASELGRSEGQERSADDGLMAHVGGQPTPDAEPERNTARPSFQTIRAEQAATHEQVSQPTKVSEQWADTGKETAKPHADHVGRAGVESMGVEAEQPRPPNGRQADGGLLDRVSDQTRAEAEAASQEQSRERNRTRALGLGM